MRSLDGLRGGRFLKRYCEINQIIISSDNNINNKEIFQMASFVKALAKSTIAICVICGFVFAQSQPKPKAAVYVMGDPEGRDAINYIIAGVRIQI